MIGAMSRLSLAALSQKTSETAISASFYAQLTAKVEKETKGGKPYLEVKFADATGHLVLKAWENHNQFSQIRELPDGSAVEVSGQFTQNQWGIDGSPWSFLILDEAAQEVLMAGDPDLAARQSQDYSDIEAFIASFRDPRLRELCEGFLRNFGDRFRRTAAARKNHHARRGGLVEHVAQMMRSADAICGVYRDLNRDLLLAGVVFHDCGKLWENCYPETGFEQLHNLHGELLGHIPIGMEVLNKLWREIAESKAAATWSQLTPASEEVRMHLLHLVASHHGTHEFGSPTLPRTPEAFALHYIDNLDAKHEMVKQAYEASNEVVKGIYQRQFPLPTNLVTPLLNFESGDSGDE